MIPGSPRTFTVPLWPVYRDGVLVAAFVSLEVAAAFEDTLEREDDLALLASWEPTPIYGEAADAVTVADAFPALYVDEATMRVDRAFGDLADFPHKADGVTKRGKR